MNKPRLGVNIDHVATLRQAREEGYPSLVQAAQVVLDAGADQITIHLREDRRHIQDTDVEAIHLVTKEYNKPLNLEIGCNPEIVDIAIATAPEWICLVPEKREEKTTEGGLDLIESSNFNKVKDVCLKLKKKKPNTKISLFLEHRKDVLERAQQLEIDAVEVHTGDFARAFLNGEDIGEHVDDFKRARDFLVGCNIACHAGHGLTDASVLPLLKNKIFEEYNIGHWIICDSIFSGLDNVVKKMNKIFLEHSL